MAHDFLSHLTVFGAMITHDLDGDVLGGFAFEFTYKHEDG